MINKENKNIRLITPNWPAASKIKAYSTTRQGGFSQAPFASLNLSLKQGDDDKIVLCNRQHLVDSIPLPHAPAWLTQVHGKIAIPAEQVPCERTGDAAYTSQINTVCAIMTADCLPVLVCDRKATWVAAIHAGWKGLVAGVIEATLQKSTVPAEELLVWLGPAIGPKVFAVGDEVREQFIAADSKAHLAFKPYQDRWLADIYLLATQRLHNVGVTAIYGGEYCTYTEQDLFYSYRRDKITGRMASLIWLAP